MVQWRDIDLFADSLFFFGGGGGNQTTQNGDSMLKARRISGIFTRFEKVG